jgi:hypothetical protein
LKIYIQKIEIKKGQGIKILWEKMYILLSFKKIKKDKGVESLFKETIAENFPNLENNINIQFTKVKYLQLNN